MVPFRRKAARGASRADRGDATFHIVSKSQIENGRSSAYQRLLP